MSRSNSTPDQVDATFDEGAVSLGRQTGVICPACDNELVIGDIEGRQFAGCQGCHGMLFQRPVFMGLIEQLREELADMADEERKTSPLNPEELKVCRRCPACSAFMETYPYGGPGVAVIDSCLNCNLIWFDQGELTNLVRAPGRR